MRIIVGFFIASAVVAGGSFFNPFLFASTASIAERLSLAIQCLLLPATSVVIAVACLARHRFFSPGDLDGGSYLDNSKEAQKLQSLLQNTLEQFCISVVIYLAWAVTMPGQTLSVIPLAAVAFSIGRVLFYVGYEGGAASRALGFTLTFYPPVIMLVCMFGYMLCQQIG